MAKNRYVQDRFWTDPFVQTLSVEDKLLFLYLLTNPLVSLCGIYEITPERMKFETGCRDPLQTLSRLSKVGKVLYYKNFVYLVNFVKNQNIKSDDLMTGIEREKAKIPTDIMSYFEECLQTLPREPTPPPSTLLNSTLLNSTQLHSSDEVSSPTVDKKEFGNRDINDLLGELKKVFELNLLEGSVKENRRYAHLAIQKFGGLDNCLNLLQIAKKSQFWRNKIVGTKSLYYHGVQIASELKTQGRVISIS